MASRDQVNVKLDPELSAWITKRAGGPEKRAAYLRALAERDRAQAQFEEELAMFNKAALELTEEDRQEREDLLSAYPNRED